MTGSPSWPRADHTTFPACGSKITISGRGPATDGNGHEVGMYHVEAVARSAAAVRFVRDLHRTNPEGLIPTCKHCGTMAPCPTVAAINAAYDDTRKETDHEPDPA